MKSAQVKIVQEVGKSTTPGAVEFVIDVYDNEKAEGVPGDTNFASPTSVKGSKKRKWEPPPSLRMMPSTWLTPFLFEQTFSTRCGVDGNPVLSQFLEAERVPTSRFPGTAEFCTDSDPITRQILVTDG